MGDESIQVHLSPRWLNSSTSGCSKSFTFSKGLRDSHLSPPWRWEQDEALLAHPWHKIVSQEDRGVSAGRIIVRQFNEIILRDLKSDKGSFPRPRCTWEELMEMKKSALTKGTHRRKRCSSVAPPWKWYSYEKNLYHENQYSYLVFISPAIS